MTTLGITGLAVALVTMGLFSGLMFSLLVLLQPKWAQQTAPEYVADIQPFLKLGKGNPFVVAVLFTGMLAPLLPLLTNNAVMPGVNVLIALGMAVFAAGPFGVTVILNLPTYTAIMELDPRDPAEGWAVLRQRFYRLNVTRFVTSTTAFALLITAAALQLSAG